MGLLQPLLEHHHERGELAAARGGEVAVAVAGGAELLHVMQPDRGLGRDGRERVENLGELVERAAIEAGIDEP